MLAQKTTYDMFAGSNTLAVTQVQKTNEFRVQRYLHCSHSGAASCPQLACLASPPTQSQSQQWRGVARNVCDIGAGATGVVPCARFA